jgi:protein-S-isoprenylcysteine O-methyltransferase Ste14
MRNMPARDQERARAAVQPSAAQPDPAPDYPGRSARQIGLERLVRIAANVAGAAAAVYFARASLQFSLGLAPANRGLVTRGPYAVVRHPLYAAYVLIQLGYLLQSMALWNVLVMVLACGCNIGRVLTEERLLGA